MSKLPNHALWKGRIIHIDVDFDIDQCGVVKRVIDDATILAKPKRKAKVALCSLKRYRCNSLIPTTALKSGLRNSILGLDIYHQS